jgi:hypothetical protein
MAAWTSADDVIGSWIGDDAPDDEQLVEVWIGRAERLLRRNKALGLTGRIDNDEVDLLDTVKDVVSNMVQRVFRNPTGVRTTTSSTGPFSDSSTYGGDQPGYLWITDEELASLTASTSAPGKAFEVDPLAEWEDPNRRPLNWYELW